MRVFVPQICVAVAIGDVVIGCVIDGTMAGLTSYGEFICLSLMDVGRLKHIVYDERWLASNEHIKEFQAWSLKNRA